MYIVSEITTSLSLAYPRDKSSNLFRYRAINNTYNIRVCLGKNILIPLQNWIYDYRIALRYRVLEEKLG